MFIDINAFLRDECMNENHMLTLISGCLNAESFKRDYPHPLRMLVLICVFLFSVSGDSGISYAQKEQAVPVNIEKAIQKSVPILIRTFGNVEAYATISVKAKVEGELTEVFFQEGEDVHEGETIFTIDPRPYEASLKEAEAKLARNKALAEKAEADLLRYKDLLNEGIVSQEQYDLFSSTADALRATMEADAAAVENARLELSSCFIKSPINGRTGNLLVNRGNLIKANADDPMLVIHQIQPIYVSFKVPERHLPDISQRMKRKKLNVHAIIPDEREHPIEGILTFLDNEVDRKTGTIKLKATFENKEKLLWPGQFVDVILTVGERMNAVVVPSQAVQTGQDGDYVFVVKPDLTVESRPVAVGFIVQGETVIEKGIEAGEQVVTDGQIRLVPGSRIEIKNPVTQK